MLNTTGFLDKLQPYRKPAIYLSVLALSVILCISISVSGYASAVVMALLIAVLIAANARASFSSLTLMYVVLIVVAEFFKRVVFIFEGQAPQSQYIVLAVPSVLLLYLVLHTFWEDARRKPDAVSVVLLLYMGVILVNSWLGARFGIMQSIVTTGYAIFPLLAFFIFRKAAKEPRFLDKFCLTIVILGAVMGPYGFHQFLFGPGPVEAAWAENSYRFSIQARRLHGLLTADTYAYVRAFSFFTDNFSFGFFQAAALVGLAIYRFRNRLNMTATLLLGTLIMMGLIASYARSTWFALVVCMVVFFCATAIRRLPAIVLLIALVAIYLFTTYLVGETYRQVFPTQRYRSHHTVGAFGAGSLGARTDALPALVRIIRQHPLVGRGIGAGYGVSAKFTRALAHAEDPVDDRHNFFGGLVWKAGLPALLLFLAFVYLVLVRGRTAMQARDPAVRKPAALMIAFIIALVLAGAFGQSSFQGFFLVWCAFLCSMKHYKDIQENREVPAIE